MAPREDGLGRVSFVDRHGLWTPQQIEAAAEIIGRVKSEDLEVVRFSFADQHGILRGKTILADGVAQALESGVTMTTTLLAKDTSHKTVYPVWTDGGGFGMAEMTGGGDFVMIADPTTFRVLPWAPGTGWVQCDLYFPDGSPVPFSTRRILQQAVARLADKGYDFMSGLEVEFHVFTLDDPKMRPDQAGQPAEPPDVSLLAHGFQYLTEIRADEHEQINELLRRDLLDLGLPLRTTEVEFGPSQFEYTFNPGIGCEPADTMVLFRNAVKQICRRNGYHATFMCRPGLPNIFSSGWHLHQSLRQRTTGENAFVPSEGERLLSPLGRHYVAGLLEHARAASVFTTPTINGYKRLRPYTLAPDRAVWSSDNRGAMIRVLGGPDDPASRVENRIGEPAANPYLYLASQIISGLNGIEQGKEPAKPADTPYDTDAAALPRSLMEAVTTLRENALFREEMSDQFIDYIVGIKEAEIARFLSEVTDWEHREYFELF
jgi:glutamine synthetase